METGNTSNAASQSPSSSTPGKPHPPGGRQRAIFSCLTCRRRKVKCDHAHPVCGACARGNHTCTYASDPGTVPANPGRVAKPVISTNGKGARASDVQARLDRLEALLHQAVTGNVLAKKQQQQQQQQQSVGSVEHDSEHTFSPSSNSQSSHGAGISSDTHNGTLLLDEGKSQFVSSLHYALLADEALLGEKNPDEDRNGPTRNNLVHLLSLGRSKVGVDLQQLLPQAQHHRDELLQIYFANVDPITRITHTPSLVRRFPLYVQETRPIAFAIFFSAVNSLPPAVCEEKFSESKEDLLTRYELGIEISLARENYLTTSSLEVLQGLILWLTCLTKEEDMGKAWALMGVAIRIALNQGLHRDPSLFQSGSMDAVTTELRRRLWCQICHLEYRSAEFKGQEPSIRDDDFTTMLPRNVEDDELVEGAPADSAPYDEERFTNMTTQLVRFYGIRALRRIIQSTYRLERRILESGLRQTSCPDLVQELQNIYQGIKIMVEELHRNNEQKFLRFCNPQIPLHRLCIGLANLLEWRCYLLFWLRMPRAYRDIVFSNDVRRSIFENSVSVVETLNGASVDPSVARFHWQIGGHAAFQAIMHVVSELQNPTFEPPDRQRALRALRLSRILKEDNTSKAWGVVKSMIDKVVGEQLVSQPTLASVQTSAAPVTYSSAPAPAVHQPTVQTQYSDYPNSTSMYPSFQQASNAYDVQQTPAVSQPDAFQPMGMQFNWDDINLGNILADIPQQNQEAPAFDWGFWGDPVSFNDQMGIALPADTDLYAPFDT
ncbi:uncharacterized protein EI97DRAFT_444596 [Westerdykella ornata]|uniref:Zn(2)-C6 fungal-type domain-containing protein n=1 Tax=Westerdykella ornata TaxID=318751 RepID=A0A6A6JBH4_WESOR|nr:uncharacterized protein EI97DRAFT_444596 [Westerdykella ornata]KAF2273782.1 hypothetical protein EI97DRAFT_444596 [Westerdykella ornata]